MATHETDRRKFMTDKAILSRILKDNTAATAVEYGLLVSLMVMAALVGMNGFSSEVGKLWTKVNSGLNSSSSA
jgi:pilus assembly protein Flp/PilA